MNIHMCPSAEYSVTLNIEGRLCSTVGKLRLTLSVPFLLWLIYSFSTPTIPSTSVPTRGVLASATQWKTHTAHLHFFCKDIKL